MRNVLLKRRYYEQPCYVYGVKIDKTNPNPETSVEYTDDAVGFTPSTYTGGIFNYGSWGDKFPYNSINPCIVKDGSVVNYLNKDNISQTIDGFVVDLGDRTLGDVMVEFPKIYFKVYQDEDYIYVKITNNKKLEDEGYVCTPFINEDKTSSKIYYGVYNTTLIDNVAYSVSGVTPATNVSLSDFRAYTEAKGDGYYVMNFAQVTLLKILFLLQFKTLNSQSAIGTGIMTGSYVAECGLTDGFGMYGCSTESQVKCLGLESLWGNIVQLLEGIYISDNKFYLSCGPYQNTVDTYQELEGVTLGLYQGYIDTVYADNDVAFFPKTCGGSSSTYFCDNGTKTSNGFLSVGVGGYSASNVAVGIFNVVCYSAGATTGTKFGGTRMVYYG